MATERRAVTRMFALTVISLVVAVTTGVAWIGQPLRLVHLLTILGLGMSAGATWAQAVTRLKASRRLNRPPIDASY